MRNNFLLVLSFFISPELLLAQTADSFPQRAAELAGRLKQNLTKSLTQKISQDGVAQAIGFCHEQVMPIAKTAAGEDIARFEFGRTSHRVRQAKNLPQDWMKPYLSEFQESTLQKPATAKVHEFADGKRAYLEPLYIQPLCLSCHGSPLSGEVSAEVRRLYPQDQATGFKLGEFRGMIWVKEK